MTRRQSFRGWPSSTERISVPPAPLAGEVACPGTQAAEESAPVLSLYFQQRIGEPLCLIPQEYDKGLTSPSVSLGTISSLLLNVINVIRDEVTGCHYSVVIFSLLILIILILLIYIETS